ELESLSKPEQVPEIKEEEVLETTVETETQDEESTDSVVKSDEPAPLEIQEPDTKESADVDSKPTSPEKETDIAILHVVEVSEEQIVEQITVQSESIPADGIKSDELVQTPEKQVEQTLEPEIILQDSDSTQLTITETKDEQVEISAFAETEKETEAISIEDTTVLAPEVSKIEPQDPHVVKELTQSTDDDAVKEVEVASKQELSDEAVTELETLSKPEQVSEIQEEEVLETTVETETQDEESTDSVVKSDEPAPLEIQEPDTKEPADVDSKPTSPEKETEIAVQDVVEVSEEQIVEQITVQSESIPADGIKSDELVQTPEKQVEQTLEPEIILQDSDSTQLTITETKHEQVEISAFAETEKETEAISIEDTTVLASEVSGIEPQEPHVVNEPIQLELAPSESETEAPQDDKLMEIASSDQPTQSTDGDAVKQVDLASKQELSDEGVTELESLSKPEQIPEIQKEEVLETTVETETQDEESTVSVFQSDEPAPLEIQEPDTKEQADVDSKPTRWEKETDIEVLDVVEVSEEQIVEQTTVQSESIPADGIKSDEIVQTPEKQVEQTLEPEIILQDSDSTQLTITETKDEQVEISAFAETEKETEAISIEDTTVLAPEVSRIEPQDPHVVKEPTQSTDDDAVKQVELASKQELSDEAVTELESLSKPEQVSEIQEEEVLETTVETETQDEESTDSVVKSDEPSPLEIQEPDTKEPADVDSKPTSPEKETDIAILHVVEVSEEQIVEQITVQSESIPADGIKSDELVQTPEKQVEQTLEPEIILQDSDSTQLTITETKDEQVEISAFAETEKETEAISIEDTTVLAPEVSGIEPQEPHDVNEPIQLVLAPSESETEAPQDGKLMEIASSDQPTQSTDEDTVKQVELASKQELSDEGVTELESLSKPEQVPEIKEEEVLETTVETETQDEESTVSVFKSDEPAPLEIQEPDTKEQADVDSKPTSPEKETEIAVQDVVEVSEEQIVEQITVQSESIPADGIKSDELVQTPEKQVEQTIEPEIILQDSDSTQLTITETKDEQIEISAFAETEKETEAISIEDTTVLAPEVSKIEPQDPHGFKELTQSTDDDAVKEVEVASKQELSDEAVTELETLSKPEQVSEIQEEEVLETTVETETQDEESTDSLVKSDEPAPLEIQEPDTKEPADVDSKPTSPEKETDIAILHVVEVSEEQIVEQITLQSESIPADGIKSDELVQPPEKQVEQTLEPEIILQDSDSTQLTVTETKDEQVEISAFAETEKETEAISIEETTVLAPEVSGIEPQEPHDVNEPIQLVLAPSESETETPQDDKLMEIASSDQPTQSTDEDTVKQVELASKQELSDEGVTELESLSKPEQVPEIKEEEVLETTVETETQDEESTVSVFKSDEPAPLEIQEPDTKEQADVDSKPTSPEKETEIAVQDVVEVSEEQIVEQITVQSESIPADGIKSDELVQTPEKQVEQTLEPEIILQDSDSTQLTITETKDEQVEISAFAETEKETEAISIEDTTVLAPEVSRIDPQDPHVVKEPTQSTDDDAVKQVELESKQELSDEAITELESLSKPEQVSEIQEEEVLETTVETETQDEESTDSVVKSDEPAPLEIQEPDTKESADVDSKPTSTEKETDIAILHVVEVSEEQIVEQITVQSESIPADGIKSDELVQTPEKQVEQTLEPEIILQDSDSTQLTITETKDEQVEISAFAETEKETEAISIEDTTVLAPEVSGIEPQEPHDVNEPIQLVLAPSESETEAPQDDKLMEIASSDQPTQSTDEDTVKQVELASKQELSVEGVTELESLSKPEQVPEIKEEEVLETTVETKTQDEESTVSVFKSDEPAPLEIQEPDTKEQADVDSKPTSPEKETEIAVKDVVEVSEEQIVEQITVQSESIPADGIKSDELVQTPEKQVEQTLEPEIILQDSDSTQLTITKTKDELVEISAFAETEKETEAISIEDTTVLAPEVSRIDPQDPHVVKEPTQSTDDDAVKQVELASKQELSDEAVTELESLSKPVQVSEIKEEEVLETTVETETQDEESTVSVFKSDEPAPLEIQEPDTKEQADVDSKPTSPEKETEIAVKDVVEVSEEQIVEQITVQSESIPADGIKSDELVQTPEKQVEQTLEPEIILQDSDSTQLTITKTKDELVEISAFAETEKETEAISIEDTTVLAPEVSRIEPQDPHVVKEPTQSTDDDAVKQVELASKQELSDEAVTELESLSKPEQVSEIQEEEVLETTVETETQDEESTDSVVKSDEPAPLEIQEPDTKEPADVDSKPTSPEKETDIAILHVVEVSEEQIVEQITLQSESIPADGIKSDELVQPPEKQVEQTLEPEITLQDSDSTQLTITETKDEQVEISAFAETEKETEAISIEDTTVLAPEVSGIEPQEPHDVNEPIQLELAPSESETEAPQDDKLMEIASSDQPTQSTDEDTVKQVELASKQELSDESVTELESLSKPEQVPEIKEEEVLETSVETETQDEELTVSVFKSDEPAPLEIQEPDTKEQADVDSKPTSSEKETDIEVLDVVEVSEEQIVEQITVQSESIPADGIKSDELVQTPEKQVEQTLEPEIILQDSDSTQLTITETKDEQVEISAFAETEKETEAISIEDTTVLAPEVSRIDPQDPHVVKEPTQSTDDDAVKQVELASKQELSDEAVTELESLSKPEQVSEIQEEEVLETTVETETQDEESTDSLVKSDEPAPLEIQEPDTKEPADVDSKPTSPEKETDIAILHVVEVSEEQIVEQITLQSESIPADGIKSDELVQPPEKQVEQTLEPEITLQDSDSTLLTITETKDEQVEISAFAETEKETEAISIEDTTVLAPEVSGIEPQEPHDVNEPIQLELAPSESETEAPQDDKLMEIASSDQPTQSTDDDAVKQVELASKQELSDEAVIELESLLKPEQVSEIQEEEVLETTVETETQDEESTDSLVKSDEPAPLEIQEPDTKEQADVDSKPTSSEKETDIEVLDVVEVSEEQIVEQITVQSESIPADGIKSDELVQTPEKQVEQTLEPEIILQDSDSTQLTITETKDEQVEISAFAETEKETEAISIEDTTVLAPEVSRIDPQDPHVVKEPTQSTDDDAVKQVELASKQELSDEAVTELESLSKPEQVSEIQEEEVLETTVETETQDEESTDSVVKSDEPSPLEIQEPDTKEPADVDSKPTSPEKETDIAILHVVEVSEEQIVEQITLQSESIPADGLKSDELVQPPEKQVEQTLEPEITLQDSDSTQLTITETKDEQVEISAFAETEKETEAISIEDTTVLAPEVSRIEPQDPHVVKELTQSTDDDAVKQVELASKQELSDEAVTELESLSKPKKVSEIQEEEVLETTVETKTQDEESTDLLVKSDEPAPLEIQEPDTKEPADVDSKPTSPEKETDIAILHVVEVSEEQIVEQITLQSESIPADGLKSDELVQPPEKQVEQTLEPEITLEDSDSTQLTITETKDEQVEISAFAETEKETEAISIEDTTVLAPEVSGIEPQEPHDVNEPIQLELAPSESETEAPQDDKLMEIASSDQPTQSTDEDTVKQVELASKQELSDESVTELESLSKPEQVPEIKEEEVLETSVETETQDEELTVSVFKSDEPAPLEIQEPDTKEQADVDSKPTSSEKETDIEVLDVVEVSEEQIVEQITVQSESIPADGIKSDELVQTPEKQVEQTLEPEIILQDSDSTQLKITETKDEQVEISAFAETEKETEAISIEDTTVLAPEVSRIDPQDPHVVKEPTQSTDDDAVKQVELASKQELSDEAVTELESLSKPEQVSEIQEEEVLETTVETETQDEESTDSLVKSDEPAPLEIQEPDTKEPADVDSKPTSPEKETDIAILHVVEVSEEQIVEQITLQSESIPADGIKSDELVQPPEKQVEQTLEPEITLQDSDSTQLTITETKDEQVEISAFAKTEKETEAISIEDTTVLAPEVSGFEPQEPHDVNEPIQLELASSESETEAPQDDKLMEIASSDQPTQSTDEDTVKQVELASKQELSDESVTELESLSKPEQVPEIKEEEVLETSVETETQDEELTVSVFKSDEPAPLEIQEPDTKEQADVDSKPTSPEKETDIEVLDVVEVSEEQIVEQITVQSESIPADGIKSDELVQTPEKQVEQTLEPEIILQDSDSTQLTITETKDEQVEISAFAETENETEAISIEDTTVLAPEVSRIEPQDPHVVKEPTQSTDDDAVKQVELASKQELSDEAVIELESLSKPEQVSEIQEEEVLETTVETETQDEESTDSLDKSDEPTPLEIQEPDTKKTADVDSKPTSPEKETDIAV
ncbi:Hypothetical predicted protein, partial [Cloeon dipterum]